MDGVLWLCEPVVRVLGLTRDFHESGAAQIRQVARHERLWKLEELDEIAHAQFTGREEIQDSQPGWIREPAKQCLEIRNSRRSNHGSHR